MSADMRKLRSLAANRDRPEPTESATIARSRAIASRWARSLSARVCSASARCRSASASSRAFSTAASRNTSHSPRHLADLVALGGVRRLDRQIAGRQLVHRSGDLDDRAADAAGEQERHQRAEQQADPAGAENRLLGDRRRIGGRRVARFGGFVELAPPVPRQARSSHLRASSPPRRRPSSSPASSVPVLGLRELQAIGQFAILSRRDRPSSAPLGARRLGGVGLQVGHPIRSDGETLGRLGPMLRDRWTVRAIQKCMRASRTRFSSRCSSASAVLKCATSSSAGAAAHHRRESQPADAGDQQEDRAVADQ